MKERVEYIDVARGIAMLLVILGHCHQTVDCTLNRFILSFHMPLFFFYLAYLLRPLLKV